ncbi:hypothetical protein MTO96_022275 [Rhipicephalus appendiculatus]
MQMAIYVSSGHRGVRADDSVTTAMGRSSKEAGGGRPRARHHDACVLRCRRRPVWEWMQRRGRARAEPARAEGVLHAAARFCAE